MGEPDHAPGPSTRTGDRPVRPVHCREPVTVGQDPETGAPLTLPSGMSDGGKNIRSSATKGAGKTVLLNNLSERVTEARDALMVRSNLSKGSEDKRMGSGLPPDRARTRQQGRALKVLRLSSQDHRVAVPAAYARRPCSALPLRPAHRPDHAMRSTRCARSRRSAELLEDIVARAASTASTLIRAGQRGTAEWTGGGECPRPGRRVLHRDGEPARRGDARRRRPGPVDAGHGEVRRGARRRVGGRRTGRRPACRPDVHAEGPARYRPDRRRPGPSPA